MSGPPPKRDAERRRRNKDAVETETVDIATLVGTEVEVPVPDEDWHPIATMMWESLQRSGQAIFYEPSDWASAYLMCESLSRDLGEQVVGVTPTGQVLRDVIPLKGASLSAYLKLFASLMMLEGDRRRLRVELERKKAADAAASSDGKVVPISQARQDRFKKGQK